MPDPQLRGGGIAGWMRRNSPDRERLAASRWMRPFRRHLLRSDLWRFTRRSVPRGTAVGLFVGIFAMIPGVQIIGSALLCVPVRGNVPVAAAMTFLSNPATTPLIMLAAIWIGNQLGFHADIATFMALRHSGAGIGAWLAWMFSDAAPALATGLAIIGAVTALIGYFLAVGLWRIWTARKWRARRVRDIVSASA